MERIEFEKMVNQYKSTIYSVCYMYAANKSEIDDYCQEVLINLWLGYPKFRGESSVETWLWRVTINTCLAHMRKDRRKPDAVPLSLDLGLIEGDDLESKQIAQLYKRISRLDKLDKALVMLWLENISYQEIADIMGMTTSNVSVKLMRIKDKLKQMSNY